MNPEHPDPPELAALRATFETAHGIVLPEPHRTFIAAIAHGSRPRPAALRPVRLAELPSDRSAGRPERELARPFPLTAARLRETTRTPRSKR
ncbi:hypothetical protein [Streptomyces sp. TLI_171]|uniref:hypothetical protein n=1 Tax=Streptomyces sp. TLI_171 TaxID=1938859 RepID=UPI00117F5C92|nr:hypothetical protein [Streptomyces sp. TLI_171]